MSNLSQFFGGSGGSNYLNYLELLESSGSYTMPFDGILDVYVIGGGGSGGQGHYHNTTSFVATCGGGAGGCAIKHNVEVKQGDIFNITIGAGGGIAPSTSKTEGNPGGQSVFNYGLLTLTAEGGGGGGRGSTSTPGLGGSASGGDYNFSGGDGGSGPGDVTYGAASGGGGSVGLTQNGRNGGRVLSSSSTVTIGGGAAMHPYTSAALPNVIMGRCPLVGTPNTSFGKSGEPFAGGHGAAGGNVSFVTGQAGYLGGGGGGASGRMTTNSSGYATAGKGGNGGIILIYREIIL